MLNKRRNVKRRLLWIAVFSWMIVILAFSSDSGQASNKKSAEVLRRVEPTLVQVENTAKVSVVNEDKLNLYIRKNAHVFNYFVLAILCYLVLKHLGLKGKRAYITAYCLATAFSMMDEFYQTFVPGRTGKFQDVMIDNIGVVLGICLVYAFLKFKEQYKTKSEQIESADY